ncbi:ABC transporter ATP-binding protein [Jeotgalibacillus proteolyticus]|uniref:Multidrug ABC transporter permease n=1 Tax=Jeotgalibacillus proteolyticus TaxID=2082395 RepID=A0A2S5GHG7_9BACL|nr:ABC transporter ATP-binding protein [Jeotgalibacillus proteolyticus]PPA72429.1 multidrug ABC transporter permease [Jeotgalibacillus proteolyticus]
MSVGKRLYKYALLFKKTIIIALLMLTVSVGAELVGPFIAKKMIDDHVLGIEEAWFESGNVEDAVAFNNTYYKRESYLGEGEEKGEQAHIFQLGLRFFFVEEPVAGEGERSFSGGQLTFENENGRQSFDAVELSKSEVLAFYGPEIPRIIQLVVLYFALTIVAAIFHFGQDYQLQRSANRIIQKMRTDVFGHIQRLPINYFDTLPAGKVVARITNDTEAIRELYVQVLSQFFYSAIYITGIFVALFILDPTLAAICLILLPILYVWMAFYRKYASKYNQVVRSKVSEINASINESIQGMPIIQAFRREKATKNEFEKMNDTHFKFQNKLLILNSLMSHNLVSILRNITFVTFIWYFGSGVLDGSSIVTVGVLYAFVDYITRLFQPVTGIVNQLANLELALVAGERVFKLLDEDGEDVKDDKTERYKGHVEFDEVSFAYKEEEYVLKKLSFEAKPGETIGLVGHTGSGKSSIMNLLFRFYDCQKGEIRIDGKNIKELPRQAIRDHMGIVLQDPYLFTGTIASNVSLNDPRVSREQVESALRSVGADRVLKHLENGFDEPVIEKGSTLSSGQRQLISFARALAFDPAILILDEATSSVDTETESIIQEAMETLKEGRTTFIIAHRLSTIKNADQIVVLDRGEIVEKGSHDELMALRGKYYQMYKLQQGTKQAG